MESSFQRLGRGRRIRTKPSGDPVEVPGADVVSENAAAATTPKSPSSSFVPIHDGMASGEVPRPAATPPVNYPASARPYVSASAVETPGDAKQTGGVSQGTTGCVGAVGVASLTKAKAHQEEVGVTSGGQKNSQSPPPSAPKPGSTRPGLYGQTLVSFGLSDVDDLLGGGLPLGSVVLIGSCTTDDGANRDCGVASTLLKYFVAEGIASEHCTLWKPPRAMRRSHGKTLPKVIEAGDASKSDDTDENKANGNAGGALKKYQDDGLRIAWQYRRYLRQGKSLDDSRVGSRGVGNIGAGVSATGGSEVKSSSGSTRNTGGVRRLPSMCHAFDLTRETDEASAASADLRCSPFGDALRLTELKGSSRRNQQSESIDQSIGDSLHKAYAECVELVNRVSDDIADDGSVGRIALQPPSGGGHDGADARGIDEFCRFLKLLRGLLRGGDTRTQKNPKRVCVVVTYPLRSLTKADAAKLIHAVDACFELETLPEKNVKTGEEDFVEQLLPDPNLCVALLRVRKIAFPGPGAVAPSPLTRMDRTYAMQVRRKRLAVKPLRIAPEHAGGGGDTNGKEKKEKESKKKPASLCGSGPPNATSALDF